MLWLLIKEGLALGARRDDQSAYRVPNLVSDLVALAASVGAQRCHLMGHDLGSAVGSTVTITHPCKVLTWSDISIAHPRAFGEARRNDPDQQALMRYFGFLQRLCSQRHS